VQTDDGYILSLFRVPPMTSKTGPVVFLQHCLLCSAADWLINGRNESLAYLLADAGYDVFLGNARGNTYSRQHITRDPKTPEFWDWSFDEMIKYDAPALIERALLESAQDSLYYIGHSQGTMMGFGTFSELPQLAAKVKMMFALAPVASLKHMRGPLKVLATLVPAHLTVPLYSKILGTGEFLPSSDMIRYLDDGICGHIPTLCSNFLFTICGNDATNLNMKRLPVYISHTPAGTSVKNIVHFATNARTPGFSMFDYGALGNLRRYHSIHPRQYNLKNMQVPTIMFSGTHDYLADPADVQWLANQLGSVALHTVIPSYQHLDFIWGMDAADRVYEPIMHAIDLNERK